MFDTANDASRIGASSAPANACAASCVLAHEPSIRLSIFLGVFAAVALWELAAPRRALTVSKALRWGSNLGLAVLNTVLLRLLFPLAAVGVAAFGVANGWGLHSHFREPFWLARAGRGDRDGEIEGYAINRRHWPEKNATTRRAGSQATAAGASGWRVDGGHPR